MKKNKYLIIGSIVAVKNISVESIILDEDWNKFKTLDDEKNLISNNHNLIREEYGRLVPSKIPK